MASIGIIANPASGKDIRRLVSHATVVDNNVKVNILKRIILAAQTHGIMDFYIMPDTYQMGYAVIDSLETRRELKANIHVMDMSITGSMRDTKRAAEEMEALGVGCIIVLGGDGTSRAAAKGIKETPLLPISTGTNNVYPQMIEGTIAGIAAAMVAKMDIPHA
jgi:predicted polyphosphate/ATP-dependent NAD kinase